MFKYREYIYTVYKEGSFSKAANTLHVSQPSLSETIKKAEQEIGTPIFDRRQRPISLTPFGVEYIHAVSKIYDIERELSDYTSSSQALQRGEVSISGTNLGLLYKIPRVLARFKQLYPNISIHIAESNTDRSIQQLGSGEVDLIITSRPLDSDKYVQNICYQERLILVIPRCFPVNERLQKKKRLTLQELQSIPYDVPKKQQVLLSELHNTPFILLRGSNYLRECTNLLFRESHTRPPIVMEVDQSAISYNFASLGIGATILSNQLIEPSPKNESLFFYVIDSEFTARETYVAYGKNRHITSAMRKMIEMLTSQNI